MPELEGGSPPGPAAKRGYVSYRRMSILQRTAGWTRDDAGGPPKFDIDQYKESLGKARLRFPTVTKATDAELNLRAERNTRRNNLRAQRLDAMFDQAVQNRAAMRRAGVQDAVGSVIPTPRENHSELKGRRPADEQEGLNLPYLNEKRKLVYSL